MSQQQFFAYEDGRLKVFPHNGLIRCNDANALVYNKDDRMQLIVSKRCCWCGSRYKYMTALNQNLPHYCPGCKPIRQKFMVALTIFQRGYHKTTFKKSRNKKEALVNRLARIKKHRTENKDTDILKRHQKYQQMSPEQKSEAVLTRRDYRRKAAIRKRAMDSIQESTS